MPSLRYRKNGNTYPLRIVPRGNGQTGMGGTPRIVANGQVYDLFLVETGASTASPVRVKTRYGVKAIQKGPWTIKASVNGDGGSISANGTVISTTGILYAEEGSTPSVTITADPCYHIDNIVIDSSTPIQPTSSPNVYTFNPIQGDHTIVAMFGLGSTDHYPISLMSGSGGNITMSVDGTNHTVGSGSVVACVTANEPHSFYAQTNASGYGGNCHFNQWEIRNSTNQLVGTSTDNPMIYTPVEATYLIATYLANTVSTYSLSGSVSSGDGTIIPSTAIDVEGGNNRNKKVLMKPNSGYQLTGLTRNGTSVIGDVTNNQYTINNVSANINLIATFQQPPPTQFSDDFNDNTMNTLYWQQLQAGTASCSESGQQLQVTATGGQNWSQAGYVTANSYNMDNKTVTVRVASQNGVAEMQLWILPNKVTNSDPYAQLNWYRIIRNNSSTIQVQRNLNGNIVSLASASASAPTRLSLAVQDNQIQFYSGGTLIYTDSYQLATYECYVYALTSSNTTGTGAFDNFSIVTNQPPAQISDNFDDNHMNTAYWQQVQAGSASCSETGQQLQVSATGGQDWSQAGYVTANSYNMANKTVTVTVANQSGVAEMDLLILPNKVTDTDPYGQPNWYRITHTSSNVIQVQRHLNYNFVELNSLTASAPITLSITVQNGQIRFYIGRTLICTDSYQLATYDCYIYTITSSNTTGTGAFDNFSILSIGQPQYTITASAGTGGSINPSGTTTVNQDADQTYTITPNRGFQISNVTVDGTLQGAITSYTFTDVQATHTIQATFQPLPTVRVITASANTGGTINPLGATAVTIGDSQTFTITPYGSYTIANVWVDSIAQGAISSYTFSNVQANHTIVVNFNATYAITSRAGTGGTISPSGTTLVGQGGSQTYTITPNAGYTILTVFVNGNYQGPINTYTFTNVQASQTIEATFTT